MKSWMVSISSEKCLELLKSIFEKAKISGLFKELEEMGKIKKTGKGVATRYVLID